MLRLTGLPGIGTQRSSTIARGELATLAVPDPDRFVDALAGWGGEGAGVLLDGVDLSSAGAVARWRAGLAVVTCRLPAAYEGPLLDLVLLGDRGTAGMFGLALGTRRSRSALADAEAAARALAGRVGLARWLDAAPATVPAEVRALADLTRALLSAPGALIVRRPDWLGPRGRALIAAALEPEAARLDAAAAWIEADHPDGGGG